MTTPNNTPVGGAEIAARMTPEARTERARKAAYARHNPYFEVHASGMMFQRVRNEVRIVTHFQSATARLHETYGESGWECGPNYVSKTFKTVAEAQSVLLALAPSFAFAAGDLMRKTQGGRGWRGTEIGKR